MLTWATMTTESLATETATNVSATATTDVENTEVETTDLVELEGADPGIDDPKTEAEADKVQAEVDKATRKARRRIDRLIAERGQRDERVQQLERDLAEAKAAKEVDGAKPTQDPREIAQELRIVEKTVEATERVWKEAKKYPDFESAVKELVEETGPLIDPKGRPFPLMAAVLESEMATDVLHYLGKNTEVAAEMMGLSATKLGRRIAQIESDLTAAAKPKPSGAAKPLTPIKPSAAPIVDDKKLTDAQWHALRKKAKLAG
jgi:hypothetical protein